MDLFQPLDQTAQQHCFVLVLVYYETQYLEAVTFLHTELKKHCFTLCPKLFNRQVGWLKNLIKHLKT